MILTATIEQISHMGFGPVGWLYTLDESGNVATFSVPQRSTAPFQYIFVLDAPRPSEANFLSGNPSAKRVVSLIIGTATLSYNQFKSIGNNLGSIPLLYTLNSSGNVVTVIDSVTTNDSAFGLFELVYILTDPPTEAIFRSDFANSNPVIGIQL